MMVTHIFGKVSTPKSIIFDFKVAIETRVAINSNELSTGGSILRAREPAS